jgi:hypothetical protein
MTALGADAKKMRTRDRRRHAETRLDGDTPSRCYSAGAMPDTRANPLEALAKVAAALADVEEGIACKGTAVESRTYKCSGKAFLFLRRRNVMVRLRDCLAEAQQLSNENPAMYRTGSGGWTTIKWNDGDAPPMATLTKWIADSYNGYAGSPSPETKPPKKKAAKKASGKRAARPAARTRSTRNRSARRR